MNKRRDPSANPHNALDQSLFRAAMRDVKPLPPVPPVVSAPAAKRPARKRPSIPAVDLDEQMPFVAATVAGEETLAFRRPGVRDQVLRKLRRGLIPVERELDLHGLNQARARVLLADCIETSRAEGLRCIRIIHGKGMRSGDRGAVLKSAVNDWLRRHFDVLAFVSAKAIDGGAGAVYVLLRV
jgi:DNA-nicking Smr family endonuclease